MSERCLNMEELTGMPTDDPRRAHLDACPRCQAVVKSLAEFMDPQDVPQGADVADAHARLAAALDREITPQENVIRPASSFWTPFRVRTIAAAAAVVIVAVGLSMFGSGWGPGPGVLPNQKPVLRGIGTPAAPFLCQLELLSGGRFQASWPGIAGATGYRVVVYGQDLRKLIAFEAGSTTQLVIQMPVGGAFCRVIALKDGDELARSNPAYFDNY